MTEGFRSGLKRVWFGSRRHYSGKYAGLYVVEQCAGCNARDAGDRFLPVPGRSGRVNALYYGDCLTVMQELPAGSVDLIYLDPPFNSARNYHASYEDETGRPLPDRIEAFCDMWTLTEEREREIRNMPIVARETGVSDDVAEFWKAWMGGLRKTNPALLAYLSYMVLRLARMRVLLRPTGSLYVHCDPTAAHYIKVVLDGLFGHDRFRNEIVWRRYGAHNDAGRFGRVHDTLLAYSGADNPIWNGQWKALDPEYVKRAYRDTDRSGRYRTAPLHAGGLSGGGYEY